MAKLCLAWLLRLCCCFLLFDHDFVQIEASHYVSLHHENLHSSSAKDHQPYRTSYHFQPPKNWMNDPNGPMIYKGIYHLFYQYNPKGAIWGNILWAHSTSTDLVNWTPHDNAIYPSQPSDINGCWSGSVTVLPNGKPVLLYTGINPKNQQVQNFARPKNLSDPFLVEWVKSPYNPLMSPTKMNQINASSFRDPTTAWLGPDKIWRVIVGNKINLQGRALLYKSKDFIHWAEAKTPLHSSNITGMWECPDFYPVSTKNSKGLDTSVIGYGVKHVLKASLDNTKYEYYTIGTYDHVKDVYVPDKGTVDNVLGLRYDYGKFYASKTFFDSAKNRRILWGWINESTNATVDVIKGWSGLQAIPRSIWLDKFGKILNFWPVEEIENLRKNRVDFPSQMLEGGSLLQVSGVTATQADIEISFEVSNLGKDVEVLDPSWTNPQVLCSQKNVTVKGGFGPFGLLVLASKNLEEYTAVFFRVFRANNKFVVLMCSDQTRSSAHLDYDKPIYGTFVDINPLHAALSLRTLVDKSIVESFGGKGKACITARVYPTLAIAGGAHIYAFNNGTQNVKISTFATWSMNPARIN